MNSRQAYNIWALQYDSNHNKTRDLEGQALKSCLASVPFESCLEIGCGTGKNTEWLAEKAQHITAVDLAEEMLSRARKKIISNQVEFRHADITHQWDFGDHLYDLVTFSLVLEHIENLDHIFSEAYRSLKPGGHVYIGELHPFKQYSGSKARFETQEGLHVVDCYTHHVSDFIQSAGKCAFIPVDINEYFDDNDRTAIPRILTILLKKA